MSILVFIDQSEGLLKKSSFEAACYGAETAKIMGTDAQAIVIGECKEDLSQLGNYGISKVHHITDNNLQHFDAQVYSNVIFNACNSIGAEVVIFSNNTTGKAIGPRLSVQLEAGLVSGAVALPNLTNGFIVKKSVFSGKAFANIGINTNKKIISVNPNSFSINKTNNTATVSSLQVSSTSSKVEVLAVNKVTGDIPLGEADIVVSGGRGLKGPENWGLVTDLAELLGAATACSRPVADVHWRPHHEHVGQTGLAIAPNLYIAVGISGAIQHLAGVNRSKTIVVINKDPEAPFFKAADYGIVGDAFEVMPKIIEAVKKLKSQS